MPLRDIAGHNFGTKTRQFREMSRSARMGVFLKNRFCEIITMDVQHDSIMFLEKVTVPSRRKKIGFGGFRLARNLVPQGCPALVPQKRHRNLIRMCPQMLRKESPGPVDRSRYPVFRSPMSSRGDIAAGRSLVKSLEIPRESAPRRPSRLSPTMSSVHAVLEIVFS